MTVVYQPPQIRIMRNLTQAYVGERDNAELPVSTQIVKTLTEIVIPTIIANAPRPFGWLLTPASTYLVFHDADEPERIYNAYWLDVPVAERSAIYDACQLYVWDGISTMTRCQNLGELQARLAAAGARWSL